MMSKLMVAVSPHFTGKRTTQKIMLDVIIALLPAAVASVILFGWRSLLVIGVCVAASVASEFLFEKLCKRSNTVYDLSAVVTGLLLAFNLPVSIPLWQAVFGSVVAVIVVKQLCKLFRGELCLSALHGGDERDRDVKKLRDLFLAEFVRDPERFHVDNFDAFFGVFHKSATFAIKLKLK